MTGEMVGGTRAREAAQTLWQAMIAGQPVVAPTDSDVWASSVEEAYEIQAQLIALRMASTREQLVGYKIGVTSRGAQRALNSDAPSAGALLSGMRVGQGTNISIADLIAPRVETEIAFVLAKDLPGPNVTVNDVLDAIDHLAIAIEVADSRIADWKIGFRDSVADNASSGLFAIGDVASGPANLSTVEATLKKNGIAVSTGRGEAVMGDPAVAVAWLANHLVSQGGKLEAGQIIMSGALTPPLPVAAGDLIEVHVDGLGSLALAFI